MNRTLNKEVKNDRRHKVCQRRSIRWAEDLMMTTRCRIGMDTHGRSELRERKLTDVEPMTFLKEGKMSKCIKTMLLGLMFLAVTQVQQALAINDSTVIYSGGDTVILNGFWDEDSSKQADQPGELTYELVGVIAGIPQDSLTAADSVLIGSVYAMSSMESLNVQDTNATTYDTVYFQYYVQNQGNVTDSFYLKIHVFDTTNGQHFTPVDFSFVRDTISNQKIGLIYDTTLYDTAWYSTWLPQDAIDTFYLRVVVPGPLNAGDEDTINFRFEASDHLGTGTWDAWPDTAANGYVKRTIIDTFSYFTGSGILLHTHNDTMWEYGDYQFIDNFLAIKAPRMRLAKRVNMTGNLPGDTLTYSIYYENDGSGETEDTVNIVDRLPLGVMFLDTLVTAIDTGASHLGSDVIDVDLWFPPDSAWLENFPTSVKRFDTLMRVTALRFQIPAGIGAQDTVGDSPSDAKTNVVADGDSLDSDAGYVTFQVRVR